MTGQQGAARYTVTPATAGQSPTVVVTGDTDLANVAEFERFMTEAVHGGPALTVDLTDVAYCDSAAVRALFALAAGTDLTMRVRPTGHIKTLLGISGLDRVATVVIEE